MLNRQVKEAPETETPLGIFDRYDSLIAGCAETSIKM